MSRPLPVYSLVSVPYPLRSQAKNRRRGWRSVTSIDLRGASAPASALGATQASALTVSSSARNDGSGPGGAGSLALVSIGGSNSSISSNYSDPGSHGTLVQERGAQLPGQGHETETETEMETGTEMETKSEPRHDAGDGSEPRPTAEAPNPVMAGGAAWLAAELEGGALKRRRLSPASSSLCSSSSSSSSLSSLAAPSSHSSHTPSEKSSTGAVPDAPLTGVGRYLLRKAKSSIGR